jgi:hypothetical protein
MKYAIKKGSGAMVYIPNFMKNGSGIQKSTRKDTHSDSVVIS